VMFVLLALGLVGGLVLGVKYFTRTRTEGKEDRLMQESLEEFTRAPDALPKDEVPLLTAVMRTAAGEHALRHNTKEKFKEAMDQYAKAREALRPGTTPTRNAVCAELAVAYLTLGGTEAQARDQVRIRWMPDTSLKTRPNERVFTVFEELQKTLDLVAGADADFRTLLARRLARDMVARGQAVLAVELIPVALFSQAEQAEAKAVVALEILRADKGADLRKAAEELKGRGADLTRLMLEGKPDEALALARRPGRPEGQVRALVQCADWAADPTAALDEAFAVASATAGKKDVSISPYAVLRLAQIAAAAGKHDLAKQFAGLLTDDAMKAWAAGDVVRFRLAAAPRDKGDEAWAELPEDPKKIRAGQVWARLWLARQNARVSGNRSESVKAVSAWPAPVVPFGKAGVALGLQDRDK
jgi:hypothetical protein